MLRDLALCLGLMLIGCAVLVVAMPPWEAPSPCESCWRDPRASTILDFDFHTFVDGAPIRCGYMAPRANSVLPRVVGEMDRGVFSDILCYPLERIECP
jgi:hypothetical protein